MTKTEKITLENSTENAWVCICGNMPHQDGFYPCNEEGNEIELLKESDWNGLYVCRKCGRIIQQDTLEVVGNNPNPVFLD